MLLFVSYLIHVLVIGVSVSELHTSNVYKGVLWSISYHIHCDLQVHVFLHSLENYIHVVQHKV